jgi:hypothetical protein
LLFACSAGAWISNPRIFLFGRCLDFEDCAAWCACQSGTEQIVTNRCVLVRYCVYMAVLYQTSNEMYGMNSNESFVTSNLVLTEIHAILAMWT